MGVDGDALGVGFDAHSLEPDALDPRMATRRNEQALTAQLGCVLERDDVLVAVPARRFRVHAEHELDAVTPQDLPECLAEWRGLVGEHALRDVDERDLAAEAVDRLGHLDADRSGADDQEPARDGGHPGHLAVGPHAIEPREARDRRHVRRRAGGHDDVLGGVSHAVDLDRTGAGEPPVPRIRSMPLSVSHCAALVSVWLDTMKSRQASAASTSTSALAAASFASCTASPGRSSVLDGMHAQYEHSPPTSSRSTTATRRPPSARAPAQCSPGAPAPRTMTS